MVLIYFATVNGSSSPVVEDRLQQIQICGPFGSSFEHFSEVKNVVVISGGSGVASSLSVLRQACAQVKANAHQQDGLNRLHFVWSARHAGHLLWCWSELKQTLASQDFSELSPQDLENKLNAELGILLPDQKGTKQG